MIAFAIKAGLSEAVAADLLAGRRPAGMLPDEAAMYDLCVELSSTHALSDATFGKARQVLSDQQIVDLVTVPGTYMMVPMMLAVEGGHAGRLDACAGPGHDAIGKVTTVFRT